jgi:aspartate/methionine/tyrosine aminotransferase
VLLNFPNNPTGYSPSPEEASAIVKAIVAAADAGTDILAICDDAYFGLFHEPGLYTESLFGQLATAHERSWPPRLTVPPRKTSRGASALVS